MPFALLLLGAPFAIPILIGFYLFTHRQEAYQFSHMAAYLTLKPIVATPIWLIVLSNLPQTGRGLTPAHLLSIVPGVGLTVVIMIGYRSLFFGPHALSAWLLLALDSARWINSFFIGTAARGDLGAASGSPFCLLAWVGLTLPSIFAVVALALSLGIKD